LTRRVYSFLDLFLRIGYKTFAVIELVEIRSG